ncbi:MAG: polyphosphate kinase 2 [gamma proteobacterium symbiont of Taylorina sp.]|nr:polyphosphate kinase 2 [gamma proteobacterium symbiont of Taylorina sp.]
MSKKKSTAASKKLSKKNYEAELYKLQAELCQLQEWVVKEGARVIVLFEGRDAAGKGGTIKRIMERTSPRVFRVNALPSPNEREKSQLYLQRYINRFPAAGEIILFDRSWYNRANVEPVMGFCTNEQYERFLKNVPSFEQYIINDGIILLKYWFDVSMDVQTKRFEDRINDPRKHWKLSPMDLESHHRWYEYSRTKDRMFETTDSKIAPWHVIDGDNKKRARLNCISHLLSQIPYEKIKAYKPKLPPRQKSGGYKAPDYPYKWVPAKY